MPEAARFGLCGTSETTPFSRQRILMEVIQVDNTPVKSLTFGGSHGYFRTLACWNPLPILDSMSNPTGNALAALSAAHGTSSQKADVSTKDHDAASATKLLKRMVKAHLRTILRPASTHKFIHR